MIRFYRTIIAIYLGLFLSVGLYSHFFASAAPNLANYFLNVIPEDEASVAKLAKNDVLIFTPTQIYAHQGVIQKIKQLNPDVVILAYIPSQSYNTLYNPNDLLFRNMIVQENWWLKDLNQNKISHWTNIVMVNMSEAWSDNLISFLNERVCNLPGVDGIFYDMVSDNIDWIKREIDLNGDGVADNWNEANKLWHNRTKYLLETSRAKLSTKYIIINGVSTTNLQAEINGRMFETFPTPWEGNGQWSATMNSVQRLHDSNREPQLYIFNSNTNNLGNNNNFKKMRFGLASSLLEDSVYFSFDFGDENHGQVWWYDEYDINLGDPTGVSQSVNGGAKYTDGVWRRDYAHGLAIVNSTGVEQTVDLGADYEKIIGAQDPIVNNGEVVDKVKMSAKDGLILLKTSQKIDNLVFDNGSLARFLDMRGGRARNGFFIFDENYPAEAQVFNGELNNEIGLEKISTDQGKMKIVNSRGDVWYDGSPFGVMYTGALRIAVGKFSGDMEKSLVVADAQGGVNLYNYYGGSVKEYFYPWGKKTGRSFSVALGNVDVDGNVVLGGGGLGKTGVVMIYDRNLNKMRRTFFPYGTAYRGGVEVVIGDVNGDGQGEIITAQSGLSSVTVRVWNAKMKKMSEFKVSSTFGGSKIRLGSADVNFDGKDEIVVMNK